MTASTSIDALLPHFEEVALRPHERDFAIEQLTVLGKHHEPTQEHSIRVGLLAKRIGSFLHLDERALLYAGLMHDIGKSALDPSILMIAKGFNETHYAQMRTHPQTGYERLQANGNTYTAEVVLRHHRYQHNAYPQILPPLSAPFSEATQTLIAQHARIIALVDFYDALTSRKNDMFGADRGLTSEQARDIMLEKNADVKTLVRDLYTAGVFVCEKPTDSRPQTVTVESAQDPYERVARNVSLACALEPLSDKAGCTTRYRDASRHLRLEYFITSAINIGPVFGELARQCAEESASTIKTPYAYARRAQEASAHDRAGGRINQGMIELLMPLVIGEQRTRTKTIEELLTAAEEALQNTTGADVKALVAMKRLAYAQSNYTERIVPEYAVETVGEYYRQAHLQETSATSKAHNGEFVKGFPTVRALCDGIQRSPQRHLMEKVEDAYRYVRSTTPPGVGVGFTADCVAAALYVLFSRESREAHII